MIKVSNKEFLQGLFGDEWNKAHVTAFRDDPSDIHEDRRSLCWAGGSASVRGLRGFPDEANQYFTISLFHLNEKGNRKRQKTFFDAMFVVVVDDVAEKIPVENAEMLPPPSYKLFTSEGSEQWGYILEVPEENIDRANNLLDGLVSQGLAPDGTDPGMRGVTRYVRLPEGYNTKAKRFINGKPFKCYMSEWEPDRLHSMEALASAFNIDLDAPRNEINKEGISSGNVVFDNHPIHGHITQTGVNGKWIQINCPNADAHSSDDASGAAILIHDDGGVAFQCHHGNCEKVSGKKVLDILGIEDEVNEYIHKVGVEGNKAIAETLGKELAVHEEQGGTGLVHRDDDEFNVMRYVFLPPTNRFFDVITGKMIAPEALNAIYLRTYTGKKKVPKVVEHFHNIRDARSNIADGEGWVPTSLTTPKRSEIIVDFGDERLVNSWKGLAVEPLEGDVSKWLDHVSYIIPDEEQREVVLDYLAFTLQRPEIKMAYTILHRGGQGVGKDLMLVPIVRALGWRSAGSVKIEHVVDGWGDYVARKKFLIIEEVDKAQARKVNNAMKTVIAPTATGYQILNMKNGGVITQHDCLNTYMMSNKRNPITLEEDDRRYYVVDSFIEKKEAAYYRELDDWFVKGTGVNIVLHYLLSRDVSKFKYSTLPGVTAGMREMHETGGYDYEIYIRECALEQKGIFALNLFTSVELRNFAKTEGLNVIIASLQEAVTKNGYVKCRGTKKIDGKSKSTPTFFIRQELVAEKLTHSYAYDVWNKYQTGV